MGDIKKGSNLLQNPQETKSILIEKRAQICSHTSEIKVIASQSTEKMSTKISLSTKIQ